MSGDEFRKLANNRLKRIEVLQQAVAQATHTDLQIVALCKAVAFLLEEAKIT